MNLREELEQSGFALRAGVIRRDQAELLAKLLPASHGARNLLWERPELSLVLQHQGLDELASEAMGGRAFPVNILLFDKTSGANWKVPGHQDLMIPVDREADEPGFTGWTTKHGVIHVEPPVEVLARLIILRIHLDDCPVANGALAVVPGSHHRGKLRDAELMEIPREAFIACEAAAGDVLLMKPLLVHRSSPAEAPAHRRVLHVVYAADQPGKSVRWKEPERPAPDAPEPAPPEVVPAEEAAPPAVKRVHPLVKLVQSGIMIGIMLSGIGVALEVIHQLRSGAGGKIYRTAWGYSLSYLQAAVFIVAVVAAVAGGHLIKHWQNRHQRDFDRRYPERG